MSSWLTKEDENNRFFVMPEVVVGHPCGLNLDSRLQTAGITDSSKVSRQFTRLIAAGVYPREVGDGGVTSSSLRKRSNSPGYL